MSFLGQSKPPPTCYQCDVVFKTWKEKNLHDSYLHDRYNSTDNQRGSWDQSRGMFKEKEIDDYFVCNRHARKLNEDFRCPVKNCPQDDFIRRSEFIKNLRDKI